MPPLREAYDRLFAAYGPQGWWPADSPLEVMIGAVLVQNTAWRNVERAIANLKAENLIDAGGLYSLAEEDLAERIQPAGTHRVKAKRLRNLLRLVVESPSGGFDGLFASPTEELRAQLLAVNGVGPETADAILLYAAGRPVFVVDAYARRVLERHVWLVGGEKYDEVQRQFEADLPREAPLFNEYHALLVEVGKRHCRPAPRCEGCPLEPMLPASGPRCQRAG